MQCLKKNSDVFAWTPKEVSGVSSTVMEDSLHVFPDAQPVMQRKRNFSAEQNQIIKEEITKLMEAGYIREVHFPSWLANVVLVSMLRNKWRVCIDFRDLNKTYPKDYYPLPRIDQLVDSTAGCEYISMLDAY